MVADLMQMFSLKESKEKWSQGIRVVCSRTLCFLLTLNDLECRLWGELMPLTLTKGLLNEFFVATDSLSSLAWCQPPLTNSQVIHSFIQPTLIEHLLVPILSAVDTEMNKAVLNGSQNAPNLIGSENLLATRNLWIKHSSPNVTRFLPMWYNKTGVHGQWFFDPYEKTHCTSAHGWNCRRLIGLD